MLRHEQEDFVANLLLHREITPEDIVSLRREVFADGIVAVAEADFLFQLNDCLDNPIPEWGDFFVGALTNFFLYQQTPSGFITARDGDYLISKIWADGRVKTLTELELLVNLIDKAQTCPDVLKENVIREVKDSVLTNSGPLRRGRFLKAGVIDKAEVDILERVLFGMASEGSIAITRNEAEILFDLNDGSAESENDPAWRQLFVRGVANYLMAALSYSPKSREETMAQEEWLKSREGTAGFFGKMGQSLLKGPGAILDAITAPVSTDRMWDQELRQREQRASINEQITLTEADWLLDRIGRDGDLHDNERALLGFIRENASKIPPALETLMQKVV